MINDWWLINYYLPSLLKIDDWSIMIINYDWKLRGPFPKWALCRMKILTCFFFVVENRALKKKLLPSSFLKWSTEYSLPNESWQSIFRCLRLCEWVKQKNTLILHTTKDEKTLTQMQTTKYGLPTLIRQTITVAYWNIYNERLFIFDYSLFLTYLHCLDKKELVQLGTKI